MAGDGGSTAVTADRTQRPRRSTEGGFSLIELLLAATLMLIALGGLSLVFTSTLTESSTNRSRQVADALLTKTMEQVRALPYATFEKGLHTADAATGDPRITSHGGSPVVLKYKGEIIPHGNQPTAPAPLNPHRPSPQVVEGVPFTVAVYPTRHATENGVFRVTVSVSWPNPRKPGGVEEVTTQTLLYSPSGCLSTANHPFAAPCQTFFYATAATGLGAIQVAPAPYGNPVLQDVPLKKAQILLGNQDTALQIEQIASIFGKAETSGVVMDIAGQDIERSGSVGATARADNDPGSAATPYASNALTQVAASLRSQDFNDDYLTVTASPGDVGEVTSTSASSASPACRTLTAATVQNGLPCGSAQGQQNGEAKIDGYVRTSGLRWNVPFARVSAAPTVSRAIASRFNAAGGEYCATASGLGCVAAASRRATGTITLGHLPKELVASGFAPTGWTEADSLIRITGFSAQAIAESGEGASVTPTVAVAGAVEYWDGNAADGSYYTSVPLTASATPPALPLTGSVQGFNSSGDGALISWSGTAEAPALAIGAAATAVDLPTGCDTLCSASASVKSPLVGTINYRVYRGGNLISDLDISIDLGKLVADTAYRRAPSAGS